MDAVEEEDVWRTILLVEATLRHEVALSFFFIPRLLTIMLDSTCNLELLHCRAQSLHLPPSPVSRPPSRQRAATRLAPSLGSLLGPSV